MESDLENIVNKLASKPRHETVRSLLYKLLTEHLEIDLNEIYLEKSLKEIRGYTDALLGLTVFEIKSDLNKELADAEEQLTRYLADKEKNGKRYTGIATDGAIFRVYVREPAQTDEGSDFEGTGSLKLLKEYKVDKKNPKLLLLWLEGALTLQEKQPPDAEVIEMILGRESIFYERTLREMRFLWEKISDDSEVRIKYDIWLRLLETAYGGKIDDDDKNKELLFLQHSYLTIVAKLIGTVAVFKDDPPDNARDFLGGKNFADHGVKGAMESDFFNWILADKTGENLVMDIVGYVNRINWEDIKVDGLKNLYENLIDPAQRHELGEYYTPDWLAEKMCRHVIKDPLSQRIIDPACGSGTFLFHAIRMALESEEARDDITPDEALNRIMRNITGIDVHPVAIIFAQVTYLLALLPLLRKVGTFDISIQVYMGDSLQFNRREILEEGNLEISVPGEKTGAQHLKNGKGENGNIVLRFPQEIIAKETNLFDETLERIFVFAERKQHEDVLQNWLSQKKISESSQAMLIKTYKNLCELQAQKRNHIWEYVARNFSRPIYLSSDNQKADIVIGNPPWVSFRSMDDTLKKNFKEELIKSRLWVGGKSSSVQDLSAYFFIKSIEYYMKKEGKIAFILPYAAMSREAYKQIRAGGFIGRDGSRHCYKITEAWAFPSDIQPLFPVPSCVLFAENSLIPKPLPKNATYWQGQLYKRDATLLQAEKTLQVTVGEWPKSNFDVGKSGYAGRFKRGANLMPRRLSFIERIPSKLSPQAKSLNVRGYVSKIDKPRWKDVTPPQERIKEEFIYKTYLGESIAPYRIIGAREAVIPWNTKTRELMDAKTALQQGHIELYKWLMQVEEKWNKNKSDDSIFIKRINYHNSLTSQFPIRNIRVAYAASGSKLAATIILDKTAIIDTALYWMEIENMDEAYYLIAILNSETTRAESAPYQAEGQYGKRHFASAMFNLPIPRFNAKEALHNDIVKASKLAEHTAEQVAIEENKHFTYNRGKIRKALYGHGVATEIDKLVARLLKL